MKNAGIILGLLVAIITFAGCSRAEETATGKEVVPGIPVKNTVTLVDLGAKTCIPCRMIAPILAELKAEYQGRAAVIVIDVRERAEAAIPFKVSIIPTQILYDRQGREVFRHVGFMDKQGLREQLEKYLGGP